MGRIKTSTIYIVEVGGEKDNKKEEKKTGKIRDNVSNMRESRKQVTPEVPNV